MIGTLLSGRFRLEEKIGSGGMSTVYRAFDETLERWVAIKVMHADLSEDENQLERFRREARAVAQLSHPHVVTVIDFGEDDSHPYIVFEYVEGETLKEHIRRVGMLPAAEAVAYAIEIGRALECAHASRLVHRDVKPQNVMITPDGRAKVTDFGIARSLEQDGLTAAGKVLGTTDYVSPEQALGDPVTEQSDVYSLGVVLYEMLTGDVPYKADNQVAVAMKHVRETFPDVQHQRPDISASLAAVVERATSKDLKNRYASAEEMVHELEQALAIEAARAGHTTGEATTVLRALPSDTADFVPLRLRAPRRVALLALIAAALGVGLVVYLATRTSSDTQGGATPQPAAGLKRVKLSAANDYDPQGDDEEHAGEVDNVFDGNPGTAWKTENYEGGLLGEKQGVGLYVTARSAVAAKRIDLTSKFPGWTAEIYAAEQVADDLDGWTRVAPAKEIDEATQIKFDTGGKEYRRYLVWITKLPEGGQAAIQELSLYR